MVKKKVVKSVTKAKKSKENSEVKILRLFSRAFQSAIDKVINELNPDTKEN